MTEIFQNKFNCVFMDGTCYCNTGVLRTNFAFYRFECIVLCWVSLKFMDVYVKV
jgi:hypothetical protein